MGINNDNDDDNNNNNNHHDNNDANTGKTVGLINIDTFWEIS